MCSGNKDGCSFYGLESGSYHDGHIFIVKYSYGHFLTAYKTDTFLQDFHQGMNMVSEDLEDKKAK